MNSCDNLWLWRCLSKCCRLTMLCSRLENRLGPPLVRSARLFHNWMNRSLRILRLSAIRVVSIDTGKVRQSAATMWCVCWLTRAPVYVGWGLQCQPVHGYDMDMYCFCYLHQIQQNSLSPRPWQMIFPVERTVRCHFYTCTFAYTQELSLWSL